MSVRSYRMLVLAALLGALAGAGPLRAQGARPTPRRTTPAGNRSSQYFARGFELDQGTDFAFSVDGIPLNLPSTLRAPGWFDGELFISEAIDGLKYRKGPYSAGQGAFAIAGSADFATVKVFPRPMLKLGFGGAATDRYGRLLWADTRAGDTNVTYALEGVHSYRPWNDLWGSSKFNAFLRLSPGQPGRGWSFTMLATEDQGDGGGAPPLDAQLPESFPKNDNIRAGDAYHLRRVLLGLSRDLARGPGITDHCQFYAGASFLRHWVTSTYFLRENFWGDQWEQVDRRAFLGLDLRRQWEVRTARLDWTHRVGVEARLDQVGDANLYSTFDRDHLAEPRVPNHEAQAMLGHGALYGQSVARWGEGWHALLALRMDRQENHVYGPSPGLRQDRSATLVSPRFEVGYSPWEGGQVRAAWGQGFRLGNAFRDTRPMVRAHSAELGLQSRIAGPWKSGVTWWTLDLEHEAVFDADASALVLGEPSRRHGLEWFNEVQEGPWKAEVGVAWSRARYRFAPPGQDGVPGSIPQTGHLKLGWKVDPWAVDLGFRTLGAYTLSPDRTVTTGRQNSLNLRVERTWRDWSAAVEVSNAFNLRKHGRAYYYVSRLPGEPVQLGTHTKGADPQAIRLEVCRRF